MSILIYPCQIFLFSFRVRRFRFGLNWAQANGLPTIVSKEGIPEEADVANTALFYSLKESPAKWAEQILNLGMWADMIA